MARNLVVFADGTGNSASSPFKTNVWRTYQALDLRQEDQIAMFDDGVGTSSFKPFKYLGLAVGFGVKRRVINLYCFLSRNYRAADRIYGFGFSRGAFIIRVLNGLIDSEGLVSFHSEEQLARDAANAFRAYRKAAYPTRLPWVRVGRFLRDKALKAWYAFIGYGGYDRSRNRRKVPVHFLGLWDTVSAYGLPIEELTRAWDQWIWPLSFRDHKLPDNVRCARHALSLDDERRTFFPIPWDETDPKDQRPVTGTSLAGCRLLQVWFAGVHANVGGGYPDDRLAHVPLCWILAEAQARGLRFDPVLVAQYAAVASPNGRLYDSRSGFGMLYRYEPRNVRELLHGATPLVEASVLERIDDGGGDGYAPISLPGGRIEILDPAGFAVPFARTLAPSAATPSLGQLIARMADADAMQRTFNLALVADAVWWRRVVYYLTLLTVLSTPILVLLFSHPSDYFAAGIAGAMSRSDEELGWILKGILPLIASLVPSLFVPVIARIATAPTVMGLAGVIFIWLVWESRWLQTRIRGFARAAWNSDFRKGMARRATRRARNSLGVAILVYGALFILAWVDYYQGTARALLQAPTLVLLAVFLIVLLAEFIDRTAKLAGGLPPWAIIGRPLNLQGGESPNLLLRVARLLRTSPWLCWLSDQMAWTVLPICFIGACFFVALILVNRFSVDMLAATANVCNASSPSELKPVKNVAKASTNFDISNPCWPSKLELTRGARYRIWLVMPDGSDWFDRTVHTDVGGFPGSDLIHVLAFGLKRRWGENWFQPIARIGAYGNDEYVLAPASPLPSLPSNSSFSDQASVRRLPFWTGIRAHFRPISDPDAKIETAKHPRGPGRRVLVSELIPDASGELFLYVNDAMLGISGLSKLFYHNNKGIAEVTVELLKPPLAPPKESPQE